MTDSAETIHTERLDLVTFTGKFLRASLAGELATAEQLLGAGLPTDWPDYPRFIVSISPLNAPSLGLAAKFGFRRIGSHLDEVDGPEDIFERVIE